MPLLAYTLELWPWALAAGAVIAAARGRRGAGGWMFLVIQEWRASNEPDADGRFIRIRGRHAGFSSWVLSTLAISDDISVSVLEGRIEFEEASLAGHKRLMIPLPSISSVEYGYHKPWKGGLVLAVFLMVAIRLLTAAGSNSSGLEGWLIGLMAGLVAGAIFYVFNRNLRLGFREHSGEFNGIQFKRSFIENREISEMQAGYVCLLIQTLIENDRAPRVA